MFKIVNKILVAVLRYGTKVKLWIYSLLFKDNFLKRDNVTFNGPFTIRAWGKLEIGQNCIFNGASKYNMAGVFKRTTIFIDSAAELIIGENCGFSGVSIYCRRRIIIGNNCKFGVNSCVWDNDFHSLDYLERRMDEPDKVVSKEIVIGDDVFIGANCIVLKGVHIGDRSIIAAGSIVSKNIPPNEVWGGNPIRFLKKVGKI